MTGEACEYDSFGNYIFPQDRYANNLSILNAITAILTGNSLTAGNRLAIRSDIVLGGGRSGSRVKDLVGPANSVLKGSEGRIYITNELGQVIWDITSDRAKPVIPGKGFGPYEYGDVPSNFLDLINRVWGGN